MKAAKKSEDARLEEISNLLIQYSLGNFEAHVPLSNNTDGLDAIIAGVNMLGEELRDVTISRDFLSLVYNNIAEILFIADPNGTILEANSASFATLDLDKEDIVGRNIFDFIKLSEVDKLNFFQHDKAIETKKKVILGTLKSKQTQILKCTFTTLNNSFGLNDGMLLIAEDITDKIATENLLIRTIVETQEIERNRFASDLHDSLGQQMSGIRFYISTLQSILPENKTGEIQLNKTLFAIDQAITELRTICFNLMPRTLENHSLRFALSELASQTSLDDKLQLNIGYDKRLPRMNKPFEIACFRIVQEFLTNSLKHGKARNVLVKLDLIEEKKIMRVFLADDGVGFDPNNTELKKGMGLKNIVTRIESYHGTYKWSSNKDEGAKLSIKLPLSFITL